MKKITATLVFFMKDDKVLLGRKQRKIGAGFLNGFGGKVESYEMYAQNLSKSPILAKNTNKPGHFASFQNPKTMLN